MDKVVIILIVIVVLMIGLVAAFQIRERRKIRRGIKLIQKWFDFIIRHPDGCDIEKVRELGDNIDRYLAETGIGSKTMYFAPKLEKYIAERYGKEGNETNSEAFIRLADWEADNVRLDVYWTMVRGNFAEYYSLKNKGEHSDFVKVAAPISILRKYWWV
jgi:hypothetical protein